MPLHATARKPQYHDHTNKYDTYSANLPQRKDSDGLFHGPESYQEKQNFAVMEQLKKTDILITTALIAGKKAPLLVTKKMLDNMPCGSVVIDMASENGGNVEGSQDNLVIDYKGIKILGNSNLAAKVPYSSSTLFANNLYNFIASQYSTEKQNIIFNFEDELIRKTCLIKEGEIL